MPEFLIKAVDAFTTERYAGNPCGVMTRAEGLTDVQMQHIARELNLSETAFVLPSAVADFRVRFFTPRREIPLAGHPTIATMFTLADEGWIDLSRGPVRVHQELLAGVLPVDLLRDETGIRVTMTQAPPEFGAPIDAGAAASALGITTDDLLPGVTPQVVSTGTPQAMVPVRSLDVLKRMTPDLAALQRLEEAAGFFSLHAFVVEALDPTHQTHARHFAAGAGIPEDPVTGSATGAMGAYLWRYCLLRRPRFVAEQGHFAGRPGLVEVEVDGNGDTPAEVRISGRAVTVWRGMISV